MEAFLRDKVDLQALSGKAFAAGDSHFFEDAATPAKIKEYLDSTKEVEKVKGMKLLLAMLSKGREIPEFFPDVVKNVVVKSIELKKMVYIYLVHYADYDENCREIALLSINSFQKDMSGGNQLIRGLALRVMTSIRVPDIIQIQLLAARKCAADSSPYVRKCAANALPKIFNIDNDQLDNLKQIIEKLLKDTSTMVLGSAVAAFNEICPTSYDLIHRSYRKLCHLLADLDEWTQVSVLDVMTRYVRNQFLDPAPEVAMAAKIQAHHRSAAAVQGRTQPLKRRVIKKAFYSDEEDESDEEIIPVETKPDLSSILKRKDGDSEDSLDPDHRLILKSSLPLLKSRNSGVVLGVCSLHYYCGNLNATTMQQVGKALVRIMRNNREVQYVVLNCINTMARDRPQMFRPFLSEFFVKSTDPVFNRLLKLEIITSLCEKENVPTILKELQLYIKDANANFVCAVIRAVAKVADADPTVSDNCMTGLMHMLLCTKNPSIVSECVVSLRQLLQQNTQSSTSAKILRQLMKLLIMENGIEVSSARSNIIWLVGEFHESVPKLSGDILRILATEYINETTETKMQIMNLAIKLALHMPEDENMQNLMTYVLEMSRYDTNTDLRDRARFMTAVMGLAPAEDQGENAEELAQNEQALATLTEHAKSIMLAPKLPPVTLLATTDMKGVPSFSVGSLSAVVGHFVTGFESIPAWPEEQPDPSVRDAVRYEQTSQATTSVPTSRRGPVSDSSDSDSGSETAFSKFKNKVGKDAPSSSSSESGSDSESGSGSSSSGSDSEKDSSGSSRRSSSSDSESKSSRSSRSSRSSSKASSRSNSRDSSDKSAEESSDSDNDHQRRHPASTSRRVGSQSRQRPNKNAAKNIRPASALPSSLIPPVNPAASAASNTGVQTRAPVRKVQAAAASVAKKDLVEDLTSFIALPSTVSRDPSAGLLSTGSSKDSLLDLLNAASSPVLSASTQISSLFVDAAADSLLNLSLDPVSATKSAATAGASTAQSDVLVATVDSSDEDDAIDAKNFLLRPAGKNTMSQANAAAAPPAATSTVVLSPIRSETNSVVEVLSEEKSILRPELGGGLSVTAIYRRNATATAFPGAQCILLVFRNTKDFPIRRIRVNFPTDIRRTNIPEIPVLNPAQEFKIPVEVVLAGIAVKQIKMDIRNDQGAYTGLFAVQDWDLIQPVEMTATNFEALRGRLKGFSEVSKAYPLDQLSLQGFTSDSIEAEIIRRIQREVHVYLVQGAGVQELMLAGSLRKGVIPIVDEKILITVVSSSESITVRLNCEDGLFCSAFFDELKKIIARA
jgi:AP-3 complex subunit beta